MSDTEPRKQPVQARARVTVDAMVQAAAHILSNEGPEALSTNRIAEVAGVSIGSLYQYFPSKDAIVAALVERTLQTDRELVGGALAELAGADLRAALPQLMTVVCRRQHSVAPLLRHLIPQLGELQREELVRREVGGLLELVGAFIRERQTELRPDLRDDPERFDNAVFVLGHGMRGALNAATFECPERLIDPSFADLLVRQACAVLLP